MSSVSPLVFSNFEVGPPEQTETQNRDVLHDNAGVHDLQGHADISDPRVGTQLAIYGGNVPGALAARPLPPGATRAAPKTLPPLGSGN